MFSNFFGLLVLVLFKLGSSCVDNCHAVYPGAEYVHVEPVGLLVAERLERGLPQRLYNTKTEK